MFGTKYLISDANPELWAAMQAEHKRQEDVAEQLAIDHAKQLFGCEYAKVQPHSGSQAQAAVHMVMLQPPRCWTKTPGPATPRWNCWPTPRPRHRWASPAST